MVSYTDSGTQTKPLPFECSCYRRIRKDQPEDVASGNKSSDVEKPKSVDVSFADFGNLKSELKAYFIARIDAKILSHINTSAGRIDRLDARVDTVDRRVDTLDRGMEAFNTRTDSMHVNMESLNVQLDALDDRLGRNSRDMRPGQARLALRRLDYPDTVARTGYPHTAAMNEYPDTVARKGDGNKRPAPDEGRQETYKRQQTYIDRDPRLGARRYDDEDYAGVQQLRGYYENDKLRDVGTNRSDQTRELPERRREADDMRRR